MFFRVDPEFILFPYLTNRGLVPYSQIADQHFPGGFFLPINFATFGFTTPEAFQKLFFLILVLISVLIFKITKKFTAVILFFALWPFFDGFHLWIDTFIAFFTLALYFFYSRHHYLTSGFFIALSILFKQTAILLVPLLLIYEFIIKKSKFDLIYLSKLVFPSLVLIIYLFVQFPREFWYWTIIFNLTSYAGHAFYLSQIPKFLIIFLPTIVLIKKYPLIFGFIGVNFIGYFSRPDLVHLQPVAPLFIIVLYEFLDKYLKKYLSLIIVCLVILSLYKIKTITKTNLYFDSNTLKIVEYIKQNTKSNEEIFLLGAQPHIYALSNTLPAGKYFIYQLPWYLKLYQSNQLQKLELNPPKIIIFDTSASIDGISIYQYADQLINYLSVDYSIVSRVGSYHIYLKNTQ